VIYTYGDSDHKHAVTSLSNGNEYEYDPNGNMTLRDIDAGEVYTLTYDAENHMIDVSGTVTATFLYNGDGQRVMSTEGVTKTVYIGNYFEWQFTSEPISGTMTTYYFAGATRVAMREDGDNPNWLLGDHLGSTSVVANYDGSLYSRQGYKPWGETRFVVGQTTTDYQFTGQLNDSYINLYWYSSRYYDASIGRFSQPDTFVPDPGNPKTFDRFAYANNNPVKFIDPSGHKARISSREDDLDDYYWNFFTWTTERAENRQLDTGYSYDPYELMMLAIEFFKKLGYEVVGKPWLKSPYANGADLVFTKGKEVLAVELKDVFSSVNLGTLRLSKRFRDYGGSISRIVRSARRLSNSSVEQLKLESQAIKRGAESGNLQNALFTSAKRVSPRATEIFQGVYTNVRKGVPDVVKALPGAAGNIIRLFTRISTGITDFVPTYIYPSLYQDFLIPIS